MQRSRRRWFLAERGWSGSLGNTRQGPRLSSKSKLLEKLGELKVWLFSSKLVGNVAGVQEATTCQIFIESLSCDLFYRFNQRLLQISVGNVAPIRIKQRSRSWSSINKPPHARWLSNLCVLASGTPCWPQFILSIKIQGDNREKAISNVARVCLHSKSHHMQDHNRNCVY